VSKLKFVAALSFCVFLTPAFAQSFAPPKGEGGGCVDYGCREISENGKYGYVGRGDAKDWLIPPRFDYIANGFANDMIKVRENGKWGYFNIKGEMVVPPRFESAMQFTGNGLALVKENGKWGYINTKGDWAISPRFENADDFGGNLARVVEDGREGYINAKGEKVKGEKVK